jgi:hypothetical protein
VPLMNNSQKKKNQNEKSIGLITSLPDLYEDFRPEEIEEHFFTESAKVDRSIHHENLFFFTRC